ncbi:hypothetical protein ACIQTC_55785, partial [Streptomyces sp. NPDC091217]
IVLLDLNAIWTASSRNSGEYLLGGATSSSFPRSGQPYWVPVRELRGPSERRKNGKFDPQQRIAANGHA